MERGAWREKCRVGVTVRGGSGASACHKNKACNGVVKNCGSLWAAAGAPACQTYMEVEEFDKGGTQPCIGQKGGQVQEIKHVHSRWRGAFQAV